VILPITLSAAAAGAVLVGVGFARARRRFSQHWAQVAAHYPSQAPLPVAAAPDFFPQVYCLAHWDGPDPFVGRFAVTITGVGVGLQPTLWYRGLPSAWLPWTAIARCEPSERPLVRAVAQGLRVQLARPGAWFHVDDPAGRRLFKHWQARAARS
jgi:hypothetical protein